MADWTVGQEVAITGGGFGQDGVRIGKIKRVLERFFELEDGSQWRHNGGEYPYVPYSQRRIEPITDEHRAKVKRQRLLRYVGGRRWNDTSTDTLEAIALLLKREKP